MDNEIRSSCALDWGKHGEKLKAKLLKVVRASPVIYPVKVSYIEPQEWAEEEIAPTPTSHQLKVDYNTLSRKLFQHFKEHNSYKSKTKRVSKYD